ncbi:MAG: DUF6443 domain-containing protein [Bacteroidota bacterium]
MNKKHPFICFVLLSLYALTTHAQPENTAVGDVVHPAPDAANLSKYGQVNVAKQTGKLVQSIPLKGIEENRIGMALSLRYVADLKLGSPASATGNFSLGIPIISRETRGTPDEINLGYFDNNQLLEDPALGFNDTTISQQIEEVSAGLRDSEPDFFSFNVNSASGGSYAGSFYFNRLNQPVFIPQQDLKLEYQRKSGNQEFVQFTLILPNGERWTYGRLDSDTGFIDVGVETMIVNNQNVQTIAPSSWYLRQISSHDELDNIYVDYEADNYAYKTLSSCRLQYFSGGGIDINCSDIPFAQNTTLTNHEVQGWRITAIRNESSTQRLDFTYTNDRLDIDPYLGNTPKSLDKIEYSTGSYCLAYDFHYSYVQSPNDSLSQSFFKRLRLDSLQERSCDNTIRIPAWQFEYYSGTLQNRLSRQIDSWGYQNLEEDNEGTFGIPDLSSIDFGTGFGFPNIETAERASNEAAMLVGNLKSVNWPDGGSSHFEYEANEITTSETGPSTLTGILQPDLSNCGTPFDNNCCTVTEAIKTRTFTAEELDGAVFGVFTFNANCNVGPRDYPKVQISVKRTSAAGYGEFNPYEFDTDFYCASQGGGTCSIEQVPLTTFELNSPFVAGVDYTFKLVLDNQNSSGDEDVKATFQIYNERPGTTTSIDRVVGGLRVSKITDKDGLNTGNDQVRTFDYDDANGNSSGRLAFEPTYYGFQEDVFGGTTGLIFHSTSIVPTANSTGNHITYAFVTERFNQNGQKFSQFLQEFVLQSVLDEYPYVPDLARVNDGLETTSQIIREDGTTLVSSVNTPSINYTATNESEDIIYKGNLYRNKDGDVGHYAKKYKIRTGPANLISKNVTTRDGVRVETNTGYDLTNHVMPVSISTMDDRGIPYTTELKYVFDDVSIFGLSLPIYRTMEDQNRISIPLETVEKNNGVQVRGRRTQFNYYDKTTGSTGNPNNANIYPFAYTNFETTFDANGVQQTSGNGWELDARIDAYDPMTGKAKEYYKDGWQDEFYTWDAISKLIKKRKYLNFEWDYTYKTGTRLIETITDIDGQVTTFTYDALLRIQKISARDGAVETEFTYVYAGAGQTYVERKTTYAADPTSNSALREVRTRQYFDGLGRAILEVQIAHSENGKDVVTAIEYDNNGRPYKQFEAVESPHSDGRFYQPPSNTPHTLTEYEASPLNRPKRVTSPDWHPTETEYGTNALSDAVINHATGGTYPSGTLYKTVEIDGNGNKDIVFTDFRGKRILERSESQDGTKRNDTYRNHDLKEREISVYPPDADASTPNLIYKKLYDGADNLIEQKVPDAEKREMVYDARDLLIASRGGNLRAAGQWLVTEYDLYGRPRRMGLNTTPTTVNEMWRENFYDGTRVNLFTDNDYFSTNQSFNNPRREIGKLTGTHTAVLNGNVATSNIIERFLFYDDHGRLDRETGNNHRGGILFNYFDYDFADNIVKTRRQFYISPFQQQRDTITQTYDHQGRPKDKFHSLDKEVREHLSHKDYDTKDLLLAEFLGGTNTSFLQECNYTYLSNRFLKGINETMSATDLFSLQINYDQAVPSLSADAQKNSNIASLAWQFKGGQLQQYGYSYDFEDRVTAANFNLNNNAYGTTYGYDKRGNFTSITRRGVYSDGNSFTSQVIDNMSFTLQSGTNKLQTITDGAPCPTNKVVHQQLDNTELHAVASQLQADNIVNDNATITYQAGTDITLKAGFHAKSGTNFMAKIGDCPQNGFETDGFVERSSNTYQFDAEGNMIFDPNKGISVLYNYFNQPYRITFNNGNTIEWLYSADNVKLQKLTHRNGVTLLKQDYFGGIEYHNDTLKALYFDVGRLFFEGNLMYYEYSLRDHLENARLLFSDRNGNGVIEDNEVSEITAFYPFGMSMKGAGLRLNPTCNYLFNGNERQTDFGLNTDDFVNRHYDPTVGRFWQIDALADAPNQVDKSPFAFSWNNPILLNDPMGLSPDNEYEVKTNEDGSTTTTQTGTEGGDETDHITYIDANGNQTGSETVDVETVNIPAVGPNIRAPGVNMVSSPASGGVETMDGEDDPIFQLLSAWATGGYKLTSEGADLLSDGALAFAKKGRSGKQKRLKELLTDNRVARYIKGWIKQEMNSIKRKQRKSIRNPPGKQMAHERGREAAKGYGYEHSHLQDIDLHKRQHKHDNYGKKNKKRD